MQKKLLAYTDTRGEAIKRQNEIARKQGINSKIKAEYGGYAVYRTTGQPQKKPVRRPTSSGQGYAFGMKIKPFRF